MIQVTVVAVFTGMALVVRRLRAQRIVWKDSAVARVTIGRSDVVSGSRVVDSDASVQVAV